jgi:YVTN family beta-propeller protein
MSRLVGWLAPRAVRYGLAAAFDLARGLVFTWAAMLVLAGTAAADTLLVVRKSADALDFVDPGSGLRLASVPVGGTPHEVSVSPNRRVAIVSNYGTPEAPGSTVSVIDLVHPRELRRIDLLPHTRPHGIDWSAADRVAITTQGSGSLVVIDPFAGKVLDARPTRQDVSHMVTVAADRAIAYVANIGSGSVSALSLDGDAPPRTVITGAGTEGLALTPDGREVWATVRNEGAVVVLDSHTLDTLARLPLPGAPIRVAFGPDGARAYVSCAGSAEVVMFDVHERRELARHKIDVPVAAAAALRPATKLAPGSSIPVGLAVSRDGRTVYVAATMADRVVALDARTLAVLRSVDVAGEPDGLGVTDVLPQAQCHACAPPPEPTPEDPATTH